MVSVLEISLSLLLLLGSVFATVVILKELKPDVFVRKKKEESKPPQQKETKTELPGGTQHDDTNPSAYPEMVSEHPLATPELTDMNDVLDRYKKQKATKK